MSPLVVSAWLNDISSAASRSSGRPDKRVVALQSVGEGIFYDSLASTRVCLGTGGQVLFNVLRYVAEQLNIIPARVAHLIADPAAGIRVHAFHKDE